MKENLDERFPAIAMWIKHGWIEIHHQEMTGFRAMSSSDSEPFHSSHNLILGVQQFLAVLPTFLHQKYRVGVCRE